MKPGIAFLTALTPTQRRARDAERHPPAPSFSKDHPMKIHALLTLLATSVALIGCSDTGEAGKAPPAVAAKLTPADLPKLKPGRWSTRAIAVAGAKADREGVSQEAEVRCVGPGTTILDTLRTDTSSCGRFALAWDGGGYSIKAQCASEGLKSSVKGRFSGDFDSKVMSDITLGMAPADEPMTTMQLRLESRYLGPCSAGEAAETRPSATPGAAAVSPDVVVGVRGS